MIQYEQWPKRERGGQTAGSGPAGVRGIHMIGGYPTGIEASCVWHRSQFKNKQVVQEMIEYACACVGVEP